MTVKKPSFTVTAPADAPRWAHDSLSAMSSNVRSVSSSLDTTNTSLAATQTQLGASNFASTMTVANLPASPVLGQRAFVTDATATTFNNTVVGGGANNVPVFWNGTNWKIG